MKSPPQSTQEATSTPLTMQRIVQTWWPLATSWLLMAAEQPALSAIVARLPDPEIHLAAWGGVIYPIALIIESPIVMLLAASTALSKDWSSYVKLRRFMMWTGAVLTVLHALTAFTPLYYVVARGVIGAPEQVLEPARFGLMIMLLWTWSIAYRRFHQGVLIRFGHSRAVGLGTLIRLCADGFVLAVGYSIGTIPGASVAAAAIMAGVICEAIYVALRVRPVLNGPLREAPPVDTPLTVRTFLDFYAPLAMTALLNLLVQPIGSAALSRMPRALESLAAWTVVSGLFFMLRSPGVALNEVAVALLEEPDAERKLRRFAATLTGLVTTIILAMTATPLAPLWFERVSGLGPGLAGLAHRGLWIALPLPALAVLQNWHQGTLVHSRRTRGITEAMAIFLLTCIAVLAAGVQWGETAGLYIGILAFDLASLTQVLWLWRRRFQIGQRKR